MSADNETRLDALPNAALVLDQWVVSLASVLESMIDQRPEIRWEAVASQMSEAAGTLWWEYGLQNSEKWTVWVAAPPSTWEHAGTVTLKAAGLETVEKNEARNTWLEILGQSLSEMRSSIGAILGRELSSEAGIERAPNADVEHWATVQLGLQGVPLAPLLVGFSPELVSALASPPRLAPHAAAEPTLPKPDSSATTMDLLLDVEMPISISFGKAKLPLKDVVKLTTGSIVELDRGVNEQVEILINHHLIARGEVVVVEGNYGVRILEIASPQERLKSLK